MLLGDESGPYGQKLRGVNCSFERRTGLRIFLDFLDFFPDFVEFFGIGGIFSGEVYDIFGVILHSSQKLR